MLHEAVNGPSLSDCSLLLFCRSLSWIYQLNAWSANDGRNGQEEPNQSMVKKSPQKDWSKLTTSWWIIRAAPGTLSWAWRTLDGKLVLCYVNLWVYATLIPFHIELESFTRSWAKNWPNPLFSDFLFIETVGC